MKLLDRYVLRELTVPFFIGIAIGVLLLIGTLLFNIAEAIIDKGIPVLLVLKLLVLKGPAFAVIAMPMAMAFAASLAMNRLARDSEITPMRMAGVSFPRLVLPVVLAGLVGSAFSYFMAEKVSPWANRKAAIVLNQMYLQSVAPTARANVFIRSDDGRYTFYIGWLNREGRDHCLLRNVLVYDTGRPGYPVWYIAREASTTRKQWVLRDVVRRDIGRDGLSVNETYLPELPIHLEKDIEFVVGAKTADQMTRGELVEQIQMMTSSGARNVARSLEVDLHFRFALPLACLVFGLIAAPVSFRFSRGGTMVGVLVSILIGFLYWNVMILSKILGVKEMLPPAIAAWGQNILFGAVALYLIRRTG